jgi:hypothetical protein
VVNVQEDETGWTFPFAGEGIAQLGVDYRLTLHLGSGPHIVLEGPFVLSGQGQSLTIDPSDVSRVAPALRLLHQIVRQATALRSGVLVISLHDGSTVEAPTHDHFENWQVTLVDGTQFVGLPGGGVTIFPPTLR